MPSNRVIQVARQVRDEAEALMAQRVIAIDLGGSRIKVVFAEVRWGKLRYLQQRVIDLQAEGLLSPEEANRHIREVVDELGNYPIALAIPQHYSQSHLVELPEVGEKDIRDLIARETINLSGLSESAIVYDFHRLAPWDKHRNPFWVTIARENDILDQLNRLASLERERTYVEVTSAANALVAGALASIPTVGWVALLDLGATSTIVAIMKDGQSVFVASFPIGGESFTNAIATAKKCSFEEAEAFKRTQNLLAGPLAESAFQTVVDVWQRDLEKLMRDWLEDNFDTSSGQEINFILSGGGALQPGLLEYLNSRSVFDYHPWPVAESAAGVEAGGEYAIARGLACQALTGSLLSCSLLPAAHKTAKKQQRILMRCNWAALFTLGVLFVLLLAGMTHRAFLGHFKRDALDNADQALKKAVVIESMIQQKEADYARSIPVLERQKRTMDLLKSLLIMQQLRERRDVSFVLFADSASYFAGGVAPVPVTNSVIPGLTSVTPPATNTNVVSLPGDIVVEVSIPDASGDKLKELSTLVSELKKERLYRNVDVLAANQRMTNFIDPKRITPDKYYSLSMVLAEREVSKPILKAPPRTNQTARASSVKK